MTKIGLGTRKFRPATAFKVKLTKRNVRHMLNRNANITTTRFGLALKRLAPMVSKVERLVGDENDILSDLQAELIVYVNKIRNSCEKAIERHKEDLVMNNNAMMGNKNKAGNVSEANIAKLAHMINSNEKKKQANTGVNDLLASFGSMKF
jgi:hypothetical protein